MRSEVRQERAEILEPETPFLWRCLQNNLGLDGVLDH
jgi:hypothetical protein